jgi:hypothetical protein
VKLGAGRTAIAAWGALGFGGLLVQAVVGLTPLALVPIREHTLTGVQTAIYVAWVVWMAWSEGYKTFQKLVAPRVAARAIHLARHPRLLHVLLAPAFCMALFHATRRRMITAWAVVVMVIALVVSVRFLPQPWRGIVDGGVVVGLVWGLIAVIVCFALALAGRPVAADPGLPETGA